MSRVKIRAEIITGVYLIMLKKVLLITSALFSFSNVSANGLDLRLSSDAAELTLLTDSSTFGYGGADVGVGIVFDDNDNVIFNSSIVVSGSSVGNIKALHFGVGVKAYAGTLDVVNDTGGALAIGAVGRYVFPGVTPLAILVEAFVAPSVSSLGDFDGITEFRVGLEAEVTPSARAYVGYRNFDVDTSAGLEFEIDDTVNFGVRFSF